MLFPAVLNPLCAAAVGEGLWVTHQPGSGQPFSFLRLPVDQFWRLIPPSPHLSQMVANHAGVEI